ncbi:cellulose synthase operon protein YhjQ/BcsQ [Paenibacillus xanthanilyticus]|uniref:Cellulose synthase operon protein YhjQ/BcsQ n=1 Tax=Paenibacillus xanthanilyticus TaxID=1783531 RepID=A0ABV8K832_9BACL
MKVLLVSGGLHRLVWACKPKPLDIVNDDPLKLAEALAYITQAELRLDAVLITDEGFAESGHPDSEEALSRLLDELTARLRRSVPVLVITRDPARMAAIERLGSRRSELLLQKTSLVRIPERIYREGFERLMGGKASSSFLGFGARSRDAQPATKPTAPTAEPIPEKKPSFLDRLRPKPKPTAGNGERSATDALTRELDKVSRGISRVIAVTGHRGSGMTSTVVNVASEASKRGLSVMIVDMDVDYRGMNMYFNSFHERTRKDEDMNASLIRTLAKPQDYMTTAFNLRENLWLTGLGYEFADERRIDQFYASAKLIGLLSLLRHRFNLILLDMPLDILRRFQETMIHIDGFALCVPNNLHAVLSTLKNAEVVLGEEAQGYLNAKSKVVVTKYNDRSRFQGEIFAPDQVSRVLTSGLLDSFAYEMKVAGHVPYLPEFDAQIETDLPLVHTNRDFEHAYGTILLRLLEGAT